MDAITLVNTTKKGAENAGRKHGFKSEYRRQLYTAKNKPRWLRNHNAKPNYPAGFQPRDLR